LQSDPRRLLELRRDIDVAFATLIERCLAKDPNRRPRSSEIARALAPGTEKPAMAAATEGPLEQFLDELRKRRVYRVLVVYGGFAVAVLGVTQSVGDAFTLTQATKRLLLLGVLAGFPVAMVLAWLYDFRAGRIQRAREVATTRSTRVLMWVALAITVIIAAALSWLLLRTGN
jgi:uncharacterized membrane protein